MERYMTRGVNEKIHHILQSAMWEALDRVDKDLDYLQIFNLKVYEKDLTIIEHHQEQPRFNQVIYVPNFTVTNETKVYIVIEDNYATMMLAEEY